MSRRDVFKIMSSVAISGPALEESIYRLVPSSIANAFDAHGNAWGLGTATSTAFALAHGIKNKDGDMVLPVPQLGLGMFAWWLQRNRGYTHALLAHSIVNTPFSIATATVYAKVRKEARTSPMPDDPLQELRRALERLIADQHKRK